MLISDITQAIGNTPLLEIHNTPIPNHNKILGKCEYLNPAGGIKDRVGVFMIEQAQKSGLLNPSNVIIEPTAGNTGLGLALGALKYGYKIILVVPSKFSIQKQNLMKALGAEIINTPKELGIQGAIDKTNELLLTIPQSICLKQFENPDNPKAHYLTTAQEIYADCKNIDYFVCGAGSGGSFSGIAKFLKEQNPHTKTILCDPVGSIIGGDDHTHICSKIEGIGNSFIPTTMDTSLIDDVIKVSDQEALQGVKMLCQEGVLAGISSGACFVASLELAKKVKDSTIITIFSDKIERYVDREIF